MNKFIPTYLMVVSLTLFCFGSFAQDLLPVLSAEGGAKMDETATCWSFQNMSYSNGPVVISGQWSFESGLLNSQSPDSCFIRSPWIKPNAGIISFRYRPNNSSSSGNTILVHAIPFQLNGAGFEGTPVLLQQFNIQNPGSTSVQNFQVSMPVSLISTGNPCKIRISFLGSGSTTKVLTDDISIPGVFWSDPTAGCQPSTIPTDRDHDGVSDDQDDYPDDSTRAYNNYFPGSGQYGTLLFEDLWPATGDYDFNDLVVSYQLNKITNASNRVVEVKATYITEAAGASFRNGFALQLDGLAAQRVSSVSGTKTGTSDWLHVQTNGCERDQNAANIIVYDNINRYLINPGTNGINTSFASATARPDTARINIRFNSSPELPALNEVQVNPYLIVNQQRGTEVHLPGYVPSSKADLSLFGTHDDRSSVNGPVRYKSSLNLPWALDIPQQIPWMREGTDLLEGYLKFAEWVRSNGLQYTNWYLDLPGFRNNSKIY